MRVPATWPDIIRTRRGIVKSVTCLRCGYGTTRSSDFGCMTCGCILRVDRVGGVTAVFPQ